MIFRSKINWVGVLLALCSAILLIVTASHLFEFGGFFVPLSTLLGAVAGSVLGNAGMYVYQKFQP